MKRTQIFAIVLIAVFASTFLFQCGGDKKNKEKEIHEVEHYCMIITPAHGKTIKSGDDINVEITLAAIPENFEKLVVKVDDEIIFESNTGQKEYKFDHNSHDLTMGMHNLGCDLIFSDGSKETNTISFLITSDIIPKRYSYLVRNTLRHDPAAYTQGLEFKDGVLYEGTGLNGKSELRMVDLRTGNVLKNIKLDEKYFGEGITIVDDKIYQLTYQSNIGMVYDLKTFEKIKEFNYSTEGWGLTHDEKHLIMSDGSNKLYFINKETFEREKELEVFDQVGPIHMINELEYINGEIWANLYMSNEVIRIDPKNGKVLGKIDFTGIFDPRTAPQKADVFNGIAYEKATGKIYVTGKLWPNMYEIEILNEE